MLNTAPPQQPIRVFIVDDHPWIRIGLTALLHQDGGFILCGEAESGEQALEIIKDTCPELAIVDISLKGIMNGIELTEALKREYPQLLILVLSMHVELKYATRAFAAGASGYLSKGEAPDLLIGALHTIKQGESFLSPEMRPPPAR